jgi:hypothetical protein
MDFTLPAQKHQKAHFVGINVIASFECEVLDFFQEVFTSSTLLEF